MNKLLKKITSVALSSMIAATFTVSAAAFSENPADSEEVTTPAVTEETTAETTVETTVETTAETTEETTTTTTAPDAVLDGDEEPEDTEPAEEEEAEETTAAEAELIETTAAVTEAPVETAAPATQAAPANTVAPDSYDAVEPFEMYVPEVLNVRGGPGTSYDKLGMVYANNTIRIIGTSGEWYVFDYYGTDGYLLAELLSEVPQTTTTTAAPVEDTAPADDTAPAEDDSSASENTDDEWDDVVMEEVNPSETTDTTKEPPVQAEDDEPDDEKDDTPAGTVDNGEDKGGLPPVLLALICAVAAFVLIGVVPVLVHKAHHKKLYQY